MGLSEDLALLDLISQWDYRQAGDNRVDDLVTLLERVQAARRTLADAEESLARSIYAEVGRGTHTLAGKPVEVFTGKARTEWDHPELIRSVVVELAKQRGGDITEVEEIVHSWLECCGTSGWRLTGLRALGIDPDEYARSRPGKPSVKL